MGLNASIHSKQSTKNDIDTFLSNSESEGTSIVKAKLIALGFDKQMHPSDFNEMAYILSHKDALMNSYLHTDFSKALELKQKIERMEKSNTHSIDSSEEDLNESFSESNLLLMDKSVETNKNDLKIKKSKKHALEKNEENELREIYDQLKNGSLRIKLIVAETSKNAVERSIKKLASPIVNLALEHPPEFGFYHIALAIGCWKIEWNNSSLCIPRQITGKSAVIAADIESIATIDQLDVIREKLADVIIKWNTSMYYQQNPSKETPNRGNCQYFIDDVLQYLGLSETVNKFPKPLNNYLKQLRMHGEARMEFDMTKDFRNAFNLQEKKIVFKSHAQLDSFYAKLIEISPDFQYEYKYEYYMLKSFDRAFWMRSKSREEIKKCDPLIINGEVKCPFGDPTLTSILQFRIKKSI